MGKPIGFQDLFDFSDQGIITGAKTLIEDLKKTYSEFTTGVTNTALATFDKQLQDVNAEVIKLAANTNNLNVTNSAQQQVLLSNLDAMQKLKDENARLKAAKSGVQQLDNDLKTTVEALNVKLAQEILLYKDLGVQYRKNETDADGATQAAQQQGIAIDALKAKIAGLANTSYGSSSNMLKNQLDQLVDAQNNYIAVAQKAGAENLALTSTTTILGSSIANTEAEIRNLTKSENFAADSLKGLKIQLDQQLHAFSLLSKSNDKMGLQNLAADIQVTRREIDELNNATKATSSVFNAAAGSYAQLDAQTKQLVIDLRQLDNGLDKDNIQAQAMQKQILANTQTLKAFDAQLGNNARNVGNYRSAYNGLNNSVSQLAREAPAFTNSIATGFLALSNNIPILKDEIDAITNKNKFLKEEALKTGTALGEQAKQQLLLSGATIEAAEAAKAHAIAMELEAAAAKQTNIWAALTKALFSWNTLLVVGIVILTLYGKQIYEFFAEMFNGKKVISDTANNLAALNEIMKEANANVAKEKTALDALYKSATNQNLAMSDRLKYARQLQHEFPTTFGNLTKEAIVTGEAASAYKTLTKEIEKNALARAGFNKLVKIADEELDLKFERKKLSNVTNQKLAASKDEKRVITSAGGGGVLGGTPTATEQIITKKGTDNKTLKEYASNLDVITQKEIALANTRRFIKNSLGITDEEVAKTYTEDHKFKDPKTKKTKEDHTLDKIRDKQDELLKATSDFEVAEAKLAFERSEKTEAQEVAMQNKVLAIQEKFFDLRLKLFKEGTKEYIEIETERSKARLENIEKIEKIHVTAIGEREKNEISAAQAVFNSSKQQYSDTLIFEEAKLFAITKATEERLKLYSRDTDKYKEQLTLQEKATSEYQEKINAIRKGRKEGQEKIDTSAGEITDAVFTSNIKVGVATGKITKDDGEKKLHDLRIARIEDEIRAKTEQLSKAEKGDQDYVKYTLELDAARKKKIEENSNFEISQAEKVKEKKKAIAQALYEFISAASSAAFTIGRDINAANIEDLQHQKDKEIEIAGDNAVAKKQIEENYQKKILELKRKQAIYDKIEALFNIGINTAVAISKASATPYLIPLIIATNAVQAAAVLAKPLPKYYRGRSKGKAEYAEVNEQGFELIERDGRMRVEAGGKPTVTYLEGDDIVHTAHESRQIIKEITNNKEATTYLSSLTSGMRVSNEFQGIKEDKIVSAIVGSRLSEKVMHSAFSSAIDGLPISILEVNERGVNKYTKRLQSRIEHLNSRNSMSGNG